MKVVDIALCLGSTGEASAVVVHSGTSDIGKCSSLLLEEKFRLLRRKLKARTSKEAFSELLLVLCTEPARQAQFRGSQCVGGKVTLGRRV